MPKILIIYYSRTNITKKLAQYLAEKLGADTEEIIATKNYSGPIGYLMAGREATLRKLATINPAVKNPADYDLVMIGTPTWSFNMSSPVRAYLSQNKDKFKKVAFFCTQGGSGHVRAFKEMAEICGQQSVATLALLSASAWGLIPKKEIIDPAASQTINEFLQKLPK